MNKETNKSIIILRGLPGSGKTSFAKEIGSAICCADDYFTDLNGNYEWNAEDVYKANFWCKRKAELFMKRGITPVIVSNTNTKRREFKYYYELAETYDYRVYSIIVENRHDGKSIHEVDEEILDKMKNRFNIKL